MKHLIALAFLAFAGCPSNQAPIYHHLSEPGAMETCKGGMPSYNYRASGKTKEEAQQSGQAEIRQTIAKANGCGALITLETEATAPGNDGLWYIAYNFQTCICQ